MVKSGRAGASCLKGETWPPVITYHHNRVNVKFYLYWVLIAEAMFRERHSSQYDMITLLIKVPR